MIRRFSILFTLALLGFAVEGCTLSISVKPGGTVDTSSGYDTGIDTSLPGYLDTAAVSP